jgi:hypothetical protein
MQNYYSDEEIVEDIQIEEDEYEDENNNKNTTTNNEDNTEEDLIYEDEYESVKDEILKSMSLLSSHKESLSIKNLQQKNKNKMNKLSLLLSQKFLNILCSILSCYIKKNFKIFLNNMKSLIIYRYNMINLSSKNKIKNKKQMNNKTYNNYSINNRIKSSKPNINNNANNNLYKVPKYYLESLKKQEERKMKKELIKKKHEEIKKKKINEEKKKEKEKTETEIEYEKYQYQKKLENIMNKKERNI